MSRLRLSALTLCIALSAYADPIDETGTFAIYIPVGSATVVDGVETHTLVAPDGPVYVFSRALVTQDCLSSVTAGSHPVDEGSATLNFDLTPDCARRFGDYTTRNIGGRMFVVVEGRTAASPSIRAPILGGSGFIATGTTLSEAEELASRIRDRAGLNEPGN